MPYRAFGFRACKTGGLIGMAGPGNRLLMMIDHRVFRFLVVGGVAYVGNAILMWFFVEALHWDDRLWRNIANVVTAQISVIFTFFGHLHYTWRGIDAERKVSGLKKFGLYNLTVLGSLLVRFVVFFFLDLAGFGYLICMTGGIVAATVSSFLVYDSYIFDSRKKPEPDNSEC